MTAPDATTVNSRLIFHESVKNTPERAPSRVDRPALPSLLMLQPCGPWERRPREKKGVSESPRMQLLLGRVEGKRKDKMILVKLKQDGFGCWLGLQRKEENPARPVLVHYLRCN